MTQGSTFGTKPDGAPYLVPPDDFRRRTRKGKGRRQNRGIGIRVTEAEHRAIHELAESKDTTIRDLIITALFD